MNKNKPQPPVSCTNDAQMVRENLRPALRIHNQRPKISEDERAALLTVKASYKKLKKNKTAYEQSLNEILKAFRDSRIPKFNLRFYDSKILKFNLKSY